MKRDRESSTSPRAQTLLLRVGMTEAHPRRSAIRERILVAAIVLTFCAAFGVLVSRFIHSTSATFDETAHLPAGYSYLKWDDYRMNPEHPPLVKKLAALALMGREVWPTSVDLSPQSAASPPGTTEKGAWEILRRNKHRGRRPSRVMEGPRG
jgi:hypothetical protein